jgi:hypothetical protein
MALVPFRMSFFRMRCKADGLWMTVAFTEFKLNAPVLDSAF